MASDILPTFLFLPTFLWLLLFSPQAVHSSFLSVVFISTLSEYFPTKSTVDRFPQICSALRRLPHVVAEKLFSTPQYLIIAALKWPLILQNNITPALYLFYTQSLVSRLPEVQDTYKIRVHCHFC